MVFRNQILDMLRASPTVHGNNGARVFFQLYRIGSLLQACLGLLHVFQS